MHRIALTMTLALALVAPVVAQLQPGDIVTADSNRQYLLRIDGNGNVTTFANLPVRGQSLAVGVANRGFVVGGGSLPDATVEVSDSGAVTTLVASGPLFVDFDVDGEGNWLGAGFPPGLSRTNGLYSVSRNGMWATVNQGGPFGKMYAMGVDTLSGDAIVVDGAGQVFRVTRGASPTVTTVLAGFSTGGTAGIHPRFDRPGTMIAVWGNAVFELDLASATPLTTLRAGTPFVKPADVEYDPATGQYLVMDIGTAQSTIYRFDVSTNTVTSVIPIPGERPTKLAVAASRGLSGLTVPQPGTLHVMRVSFPGHAGSPYLAALSFGMGPGFNVPGGTVYLTVDALFLLSIANAGIFSGFQGLLDASGEASPTLVLPNLAGLTGLRYYGVAVAVPPSGPLAVSEPAGFTIR